jgi:branched-chain amino acid transport system substrate-binding protein
VSPTEKIMTIRLSTIAVFTLLAGVMMSAVRAHAQAPRSIRIGYAISLSGSNAPGASITVLPNYRLWVKELNAAGGIMLKSVGKRLPIEVIEYDDHSSVDKALESVERLITQDRVDLIF